MASIGLLPRLEKWNGSCAYRGDGPFIGLEQRLQRDWPTILINAGVEGVTIHDLRRTCITRLAKAGASIDEARKLAGHSSVQTTLKYYTATKDEDLIDADQKLAAYLASQKRDDSDTAAATAA